MLPSYNGYASVQERPIWLKHGITNKARVLRLSIFQHFIKICIMRKLVQIYICPPGAQCDVISKGHMGYTFSFGSVGSAFRSARKV